MMVKYGMRLWCGMVWEREIDDQVKEWELDPCPAIAETLGDNGFDKSCRQQSHVPTDLGSERQTDSAHYAHPQ